MIATRFNVDTTIARSANHAAKQKAAHRWERGLSLSV